MLYATVMFVLPYFGGESDAETFGASVKLWVVT